MCARRSMLYLPGGNARALEKAATLDVDALIFDLEDPVAPEAKQAARDCIRNAMHSHDYGCRECLLRINGPDSDWWKDDLQAMAGLPFDGLLFPKINSADDLRRVAEGVAAHWHEVDVPLWAMAETAAGVLNIADICRASANLAGIVMGTSDLARELRVSPLGDRPGLLHALSQCILAARAHSLVVLDGVTTDLQNEQALQQACEQGRALGFDGKTLIHPKQIDAAHQAFTPAADEVEYARRVLAAWQQTRDAGQAVTVVDGKLIEALNIEEARYTLALHEATQS